MTEAAPDETLTLEAMPRPVPASPRAWCVVVVDHPRGDALGRRAALAGPGEVLVARRAEWLGLDTFRDGRISREHARLALDAADTLVVEDLGSHNGTFVNGDRATRATLREGDVVSVGSVQLLVVRGPRDHVPDRSMPFVAASPAMAAVVAALDRWTDSGEPLAIVGEPGTGRSLLAEKVHTPGGPLVVLTPASLPDELVATTLFGHERGAFPGAVDERAGLIESASGGTLVLDGLEDVRPALAAALAGVLDAGVVRRVGATATRPVALRLVAITSTAPADLGRAGRLHPALAARFGLAVVRVPPLRERKEDIPLLVRAILEDAAGGAAVVDPALVRALLAHDWPHNVRELMTFLGGALRLDAAGPLRLTAELAAALGASHELARQAVDVGRLTIARSGAFLIDATGRRVDLAARKALRAIVARLVEAASSTDAPALSVDALFAAGWPGERAARSAAATRVYVALATLRREGLKDVLARDPGGYRLVVADDVDLVDA